MHLYSKDLLITVNIITGFAYVILGFSVIPIIGILMLFLIVSFEAADFFAITVCNMKNPLSLYR